MEDEEQQEVLMQTEFNEDYEPTPEEVHEYAQYIGLDPLQDQDLLWLAEEGIKAPLPEDWKAFRNQEQELIYVNVDTQEAMVEHPMDQVYMARAEELKQQQYKQTHKTKRLPRLAEALSRAVPEDNLLQQFYQQACQQIDDYYVEMLLNQDSDSKQHIMLHGINLKHQLHSDKIDLLAKLKAFRIEYKMQRIRNEFMSERWHHLEIASQNKTQQELESLRSHHHKQIDALTCQAQNDVITLRHKLIQKKQNKIEAKQQVVHQMKKQLEEQNKEDMLRIKRQVKEQLTREYHQQKQQYRESIHKENEQILQNMKRKHEQKWSQLKYSHSQLEEEWQIRRNIKQNENEIFTLKRSIKEKEQQPEIKVSHDQEMLDRVNNENQIKLKLYAKEHRQKIIELKESIEQRLKEFQQNEKHCLRLKKAQLTNSGKNIMYMDKRDMESQAVQRLKREKIEKQVDKIQAEMRVQEQSAQEITKQIERLKEEAMIKAKRQQNHERIKQVITKEEERVLRNYLALGEKRMLLIQQQRELQEKRTKFYKEILGRQQSNEYMQRVMTKMHQQIDTQQERLLKTKLAVEAQYKEVADKKEALEDLKECLRNKSALPRLESLFSRYQKLSWQDAPIESLEVDLSESLDLTYLEELPEERHFHSTNGLSILDSRSPIKSQSSWKSKINFTPSSAQKSTPKLNMAKHHSTSKIFKSTVFNINYQIGTLNNNTLSTQRHWLDSLGQYLHRR